jgi:hypothetical protein
MVALLTALPRTIPVGLPALLLAGLLSATLLLTGLARLRIVLLLLVGPLVRVLLLRAHSLTPRGLLVNPSPVEGQRRPLNKVASPTTQIRGTQAQFRPQTGVNFAKFGTRRSDHTRL